MLQIISSLIAMCIALCWAYVCVCQLRMFLGVTMGFLLVS